MSADDGHDLGRDAPDGAAGARPLVRRVAATDEAEWSRLFHAYRAFYGLPDDDAAVGRTWTWVLGEQHGLSGLVAQAPDDGRLLGLANLRTFARPSTGTIGLYLDDLFVDPGSRRGGVGEALLLAAGREGDERGATVVRWITAADNATARRLYDRLATATRWVTYDMSPGG